VDLEIAPGVVVTFVRQAILEVRRPAESTAVAEDLTKPADGTV
jgi:preprotein translocase subunit YajC